MGARTWMLVYSAGDPKEILKSKPTLDRDRTTAFAKKLFPADNLEPLNDGSLAYTNPEDEELVIGCFPNLSIVAASEFAIDHPSNLPADFLSAAPNQTVYLHAMHSVVDWFAYTIWQNGQLQRSLSLSPDSGVLEDIGARRPFEEPYWAGHHPATPGGKSKYPFVFHPLDLAEAALLDLFGYQLEARSRLDPEEIPLMCFKRFRTWWHRS